MTLVARCALALFVFAGFHTAGWAAKIGPEFQANTYTTSHQRGSSVARIGNGGFVIVWHSNNQDGSLNGVYGQRFDASGSPDGSEFKVNKTTSSVQESPSVASLADGGFVVFWHSFSDDGTRYNIHGQRYDSAGKRVGRREFKANKYTASDQKYPRVAGLPDGGYVVVWQSSTQDGDGDGVFGQRYDSAGKRTGKRDFKVNKNTNSNQNRPNIAALADGGFNVVWQSNGGGLDPFGWGVYGQRYDVAGKRTGAREFKVNRTTVSDQYGAAVAPLESGGYVIVWQSYSGTSTNAFEVFGQRYDAAGKRAGKREFMINKTAYSSQRYAAVAGLAEFGFVVVWQDDFLDGSSAGIFGQRYDTSGKRVGTREFKVNKTTDFAQQFPSVAGLGEGEYVATWSSNAQDGDGEGVFGQRFGP